MDWGANFESDAVGPESFRRVVGVLSSEKRVIEGLELDSPLEAPSQMLLIFPRPWKSSFRSYCDFIETPEIGGSLVRALLETAGIDSLSELSPFAKLDHRDTAWQKEAIERADLPGVRFLRFKKDVPTYLTQGEILVSSLPSFLGGKETPVFVTLDSSACVTLASLMISARIVVGLPLSFMENIGASESQIDLLEKIFVRLSRKTADVLQSEDRLEGFRELERGIFEISALSEPRELAALGPEPY